MTDQLADIADEKILHDAHIIARFTSWADDRWGSDRDPIEDLLDDPEIMAEFEAAQLEQPRVSAPLRSLTTACSTMTDDGSSYDSLAQYGAQLLDGLHSIPSAWIEAAADVAERIDNDGGTSTMMALVILLTLQHGPTDPPVVDDETDDDDMGTIDIEPAGWNDGYDPDEPATRPWSFAHRH